MSESPTILLINGPNLNLLGERDPAIYGTSTLADLEELSRRTAEDLGLKLRALQSNHEGEIVEAIQEARRSAAGIIINAGAFSHYSWAIHDALDTFEGPVVELHLSNPGAREEFRHHSVITPVASGVISGFRAEGYPLAVRAIAGLIQP